MKPSADKDIKKYAETVQKLRENRNLSDDEFALLMGCSGTPSGRRNCPVPGDVLKTVCCRRDIRSSQI